MKYCSRNIPKFSKKLVFLPEHLFKAIHLFRTNIQFHFNACKIRKSVEINGSMGTKSVNCFMTEFPII